MIQSEAPKNEDFLATEIALMPLADWQESLPCPFLFSVNHSDGDDDIDEEESFDDMDDDFEDDDFEDDDFDDDEDDFEDEDEDEDDDDDFDYEENVDYDDFDE